MADVVVCVPRQRWRDWIREGSLPGDQSAQRFGFYVKTDERPPVEPGDRVYVIAWDRLRGYAPLLEMREEPEGFTMIRAGNAVACTLQVPAKAFPGWKVRWWQRADEVPFPDWQTAGVDDAPKASRKTVKHAFVRVLQPRHKEPLTPEEFDRQYAAAKAEIDVLGGLSFEGLTDQGWKRFIWTMRCGASLARSKLCFRPLNHDGPCSSQWSDR